MRKAIQLGSIVITLAAIVLLAPWVLAQDPDGSPIQVLPPVLTTIGYPIDTTQYCIARGQPFTLTSSDIFDEDAKADPTYHPDDITTTTWKNRYKATPQEEWPSTWSDPLIPSITSGGGYHWTSSLLWSVHTDGYYQFKVIVNDVPREDLNDDFDPGEATIAFEVRGVDYIVVMPDVVEIETGNIRWFYAYCYNYGSDATRHWADNGDAIPETADDDRPVRPIIAWDVGPFELDYELSTYWSDGRTLLRSVEENGQTGWGEVLAYCHGSWQQQGDEVWDSGYFHLVAGNYSIDIQDTDGDKYLRNLPINGKDDVTDEVGEIRAKLEIEGPADGDYHVTLSESSSKISLDPTTLEGTFDSEGKAERTFDVISTSSTPSAALEDIEITAEIRETSQGDVEAQTDELITAFRFLFAPLGDYTYHDPESSGHGSTDDDDFEAWAVTDTGNLREYASLEEHFTMKVVDYRSGAFDGEVSARGKIEFRPKIQWHVLKGNDENDGTEQITIEFYIVSFSLSSTGPDDVAGIAYDLAVKMPSHTSWQQYGGGGNAFDVSTREYTVDWPEYYDEWEGAVLPVQNVADGTARTYSVGDETETHTIKLLLEVATKTSDPWDGPEPGDVTSGCDADGSIEGRKGVAESPFPWLIGDTHLEDLDGVLEITETE